MDEKQFKEMNEKLQAIENLLILQLIQGGATAGQIEKVLQVKSFASTNIPKSFSIKDLRRKND
jgi:hypothetical protein